MPNELSEKVYPDGTVVKLRDDTAREQIAAVGDLLSGQYQLNENVPANSSKDYTISFGKTFSTPPIVVANIYGYLNPKTELMGPNICQVTTTDFIIRVYNSYSQPLSCKVNWLARG